MKADAHTGEIHERLEGQAYSLTKGEFELIQENDPLAALCNASTPEDINHFLAFANGHTTQIDIIEFSLPEPDQKLGRNQEHYHIHDTTWIMNTWANASDNSDKEFHEVNERLSRGSVFVAVLKFGAPYQKFRHHDPLIIQVRDAIKQEKKQSAIRRAHYLEARASARTESLLDEETRLAINEVKEIIAKGAEAGQQYKPKKRRRRGYVEPFISESELPSKPFKDRLRHALLTRWGEVEDNDQDAWRHQPYMLRRMGDFLAEETEDSTPVRAGFTAATGTGKTRVMQTLTNIAVEQSNPEDIVVYISDSVEHLMETRDTYSNVYETEFMQEAPVAWFYSEKEFINNKTRVVFTTYHSVAKLTRLLQDNGRHISLVVADEAHELVGDRSDMFLNLPLGDAIVTGWTATPVGKRSLEDLGFTTVYNLPFEEAIRRGTLAPISALRPLLELTNEDRKKVHEALVRSDYVVTDLVIERLAETQAYMRMVVDLVFEHCSIMDADGKIIGFESTFIPLRRITQAERVFEAIVTDPRMPGDLAERVGIAHSMRDASENSQALRNVRNGVIDIFVTVKKFRQGIDVPSITRVIIPPSRSLIEHDQTIGRGARIDPKNPNKILVVFEPHIDAEAELAGYRTVPQMLGLSTYTPGRVYYGQSDYEYSHNEDHIPIPNLPLILNTRNIQFADEAFTINASGSTKTPDSIVRDRILAQLSNRIGMVKKKGEYKSLIRFITDHEGDTDSVEAVVNETDLLMFLDPVSAKRLLMLVPTEELVRIVHSMEQSSGIQGPMDILNSPQDFVQFTRSLISSGYPYDVYDYLSDEQRENQRIFMPTIYGYLSRWINQGLLPDELRPGIHRHPTNRNALSSYTAYVHTAETFRSLLEIEYIEATPFIKELIDFVDSFDQGIYLPAIPILSSIVETTIQSVISELQDQYGNAGEVSKEEIRNYLRTQLSHDKITPQKLYRDILHRLRKPCERLIAQRTFKALDNTLFVKSEAFGYEYHAALAAVVFHRLHP